METVEMDLMQAQIGSLATDVARLEAKVAAGGGGTDIPTPTADDNGKILKVVNSAYALRPIASDVVLMDVDFTSFGSAVPFMEYDFDAIKSLLNQNKLPVLHAKMILNGDTIVAELLLPITALSYTADDPEDPDTSYSLTGIVFSVMSYDTDFLPKMYSGIVDANAPGFISIYQVNI